MHETTAAASKLFAYWTQPLFAVDGQTHQAFDVALAAMLRGEWSSFERRVAEGLACQAYAAHDHFELQSGALDAAAEAFRYDRDLIAADEINAWLDRTGVSSDDWYAYLGRTLLRRQHQQKLDDLLDRCPPTSRDLLTSAFVDGVCSGAFETFERTAAGHAALAASAPTTESAISYRDLAERVAHTHAHWLASWRAPDVLIRLERLAAVEAACSRVVATVATPDQMATVVEVHKLDWRLVETLTLSFPTEHGAREALLCVKSDGLSLYDVAAISRRPAVRAERFFDALEPELRDRVMALDDGAVAGPYAAGDTFELSMVLGHRLPSLTDASVLTRAQTVLIETAMQRASEARVTRPN